MRHNYAKIRGNRRLISWSGRFMATPQHTIQITLPAEAYERIEALAAQTERSVESLALEAVLERLRTVTHPTPNPLADHSDEQLWQMVNEHLTDMERALASELVFTLWQHDLNADQQVDLNTLHYHLRQHSEAASNALQLLRDRALEERADERRWQAAFDQSFDKILDLSERIVTEHQAGRTEELDPDTL